MTGIISRLRGVYYGWWVVGASFFVALYVGGVVFYGFTAIFQPIADDLGWSYTQISIAASLRGLEMGLLAPVAGLLVDKWGPRRLIFAGVILTGSGLFLLSRTTSLVMFYSAFVLIALGMSACTMTVLMSAVARWFKNKIGLASGIAVTGFGFGGLVIQLIVRLIDAYDWRVAITILAIGIFVLILPLTLVFKQPQKIETSDENSQRQEEPSIKVSQAFKTPAFWLLAFVFTCHVLLVNTTVTHVMPYLDSEGMTENLAGLVATAIPLSSIIGRIGVGWLGDRFDRRKVTAIAIGGMGLGMFCFALAPSAGMWLLIPFLVLFGIGYGGVNSMRPALVQGYFGTLYFGSIFGMLIGFNMVGSITGPVLGGWAFDTFGTYRGIWFALAAVPILAMVAIFSAKPVMVNK